MEGIAGDDVHSVAGRVLGGLSALEWPGHEAMRVRLARTAKLRVLRISGTCPSEHARTRHVLAAQLNLVSVWRWTDRR